MWNLPPPWWHAVQTVYPARTKTSNGAPVNTTATCSQCKCNTGLGRKWTFFPSRLWQCFHPLKCPCHPPWHQLKLLHRCRNRHVECGTQLEWLEGHSQLVMILFTSKGNCALRVQTQSHKTMKVIAITFCNERPPTGTNLHLPQSLQLPLSLHHFYATLNCRYYLC